MILKDWQHHKTQTLLDITHEWTKGTGIGNYLYQWDKGISAVVQCLYLTLGKSLIMFVLCGAKPFKYQKLHSAHNLNLKTMEVNYPCAWSLDWREGSSYLHTLHLFYPEQKSHSTSGIRTQQPFQTIWWWKNCMISTQRFKLQLPNLLTFILLSYHAFWVRWWRNKIRGKSFVSCHIFYKMDMQIIKHFQSLVLRGSWLCITDKWEHNI